MRSLTKRQREILDYILSSIRRRDRFPSYREIGRKFRLNSSATVSQHLDALVRKGFLTKAGRKLMLSPEARGFRGVPIVGRVAAGLPITAIENREGHLDMESLFPEDAVHFAVRVNGDSMADAGIMDGDYVAVKPRSTIENGKIGVILLDDDATVKRVHIRGSRIALQPANKAAGYKTRYISRNSERAQVIGQVIGCIRKL